MPTDELPDDKGDAVPVHPGQSAGRTRSTSAVPRWVATLSTPEPTAVIVDELPDGSDTLSETDTFVSSMSK
jgi:hypothetical protein